MESTLGKSRNTPKSTGSSIDLSSDRHEAYCEFRPAACFGRNRPGSSRRESRISLKVKVKNITVLAK